MSATVDANILVYASNEADPAHAACRALVEQLADGPDLVYLFWPTLLGYGVSLIYTRDRDFRRFDNIAVHDPTAP